MNAPLQYLWQLQRRIRGLRRVMSLSDTLRLSFSRSHGREMTVRLRPSGHEISLRAGTSDVDCLEKVFVQREYESPFRTAPRIIVDAGANVGMATLFFAGEFPAAKIVAIEPEQSNFKVLQRNCRGLANVTLLNAALWGNERSLQIDDSSAEKWGFEVSEKSSGAVNGSQSVAAVTIPRLMKSIGAGRIDILKLDIEGAEREVFNAGADAWLGQVDQIIIELHDRFHDGCSKAFYSAVTRRLHAQEIRGENIFVKLGEAHGG